MIKLSNRLIAVADYINDNDKVVDIGCDHGLLDVYLAQTRKNITIIASDINANALNNASMNIKKYKVEKFVETRLSNGLEKINKEEIDTIVMSGMGSHTMVGILYNNIKKLINVKKIIVQSNTDIAFLRQKIVLLNYYITGEKLVKEGNIIYTIICFEKGKKRYSKKELFFGPFLLKENSSLFQEKNKEEKAKMELLLKLIPKNHYHHRLKINRNIKLYNKIIK